MSESVSFCLTILAFSLTYGGLAAGRLPWVRTDRPGIALVGAALVLATGLLSFDDAIRAVDFATLALLLGMMIVVAYLRRAGFFELLASWSLRRVESPAALLAITVALSGVLSALLVNDVVCLALTPLVLRLARRLALDPKPHLIGLALASNAGSVATLTGNPQNMIIGGLAHVNYLRFAVKLVPVAVISLVIVYVFTWLTFRSSLRSVKSAEADSGSDNEHDWRMHPKQRALLIKSLLATAIAVSLFFGGFSMAIVALGAASALLLDRVRPERIYHQIDWGLLVMFAGLFMVVRAFEVHVLAASGIAAWTPLQDSPVALLSAVSAGLSNLVSNVPAVLLFQPVIASMPIGQQESAWLALAMSSTLAGNLSILGSVANLIVVERARKEGVSINLWDYCRVGVPVTSITLMLGVAWLRYVSY